LNRAFLLCNGTVASQWWFAPAWHATTARMTFMPLMNPAGGLRYHLRALRFKNREWQPFRWNVGEWLLGWQPPESTLVLVGPSAGYCLQPFFFERFKRVIALEPDPFARYLFKRQLHRARLDPQPQLEFVGEDHLVSNPERLPRLLADTPDSALLFTNVLGQLRALLGADDERMPAFQRVKAAIREGLQGRSWASFHDRVSGYISLAVTDPVTADTQLTNDEIVEELYDGRERRIHTGQRELVDHLTEGLLPSNRPHTYFQWEIEPGRFHIIEAVAQLRGQS
jgi:hypothetical protein